MASLSSRRVCGTIEFAQGLAAVPTGLTTVTSKDSVIYQIVVSNTTAGALTFLVKDFQATPGQVVPTISIPANTVDLIIFGEGIFCSGGVQWIAGGAGLQAEIYGTHRQ